MVRKANPEKAAEKAAKVEELVSELKNRAERFKESDELFRQYIRSTAKFYRYSPANQFLITLQRPDATAVRSFKQWIELGRCVRKGSKALYIVAPRPYKKEGVTGEEKEYVSFVHVPVFAYEDTDAIEGHPNPWESYTFPTLTEEVGGEWVDAIVRSLEDDGHRVTWFDDARSYRGQFLVPEKEAIVFEITLQRNMPALQKLNTLVHELSHAHHWQLEPNLLRIWSRDRIEFIAEAASYSVLSELGFDSSLKSVSYVAAWSGEKQSEDAEKVAMKLICDIVGRIMERLESLDIEAETVLEATAA